MPMPQSVKREGVMFSTRTLRLPGFLFALIAVGLPTALLADLSYAQTEASAQTPGYRLGIFPYLSPRNTIELYGPASASMSQALGTPVKLESTASFSGFLEGMSAQLYDIALIQPFDYVEVVEKLGYIPVARMSAPLVTQFFVRDDSKYQTLEDLRGTAVAMPPALSANARMATRALLDNKLAPGRDVDVHYFNSHDSCIQQVWIGNASACGTAWPPILIFQDHMKAKLRPIYDTPALPHILFVAHPRVPAAQRAKLRELIVGWSQNDDGRVLLKGLGFPGFAAVNAAEYAVMAHFELSSPAGQTTKSVDTELMLGVFPYLPARQLAEQLAPLNSALAAAAGRAVQLRSASSFGNFLDNVAGGGYDLILVQPFDYTIAAQRGYLPLVRVDGDIDAHAFVRADSPYQSLADLKGRSVAMPPFEAAMSRLGRLGLIAAGLVPGRDISVDYRRAHDSCLQQVQQGLAAACITSQLALAIVPKEVSGNLRSIAEMGSVPGMVFLAHPRVPEDLRNRWRAEMLSWGSSEAGRKIITETHLGPFVPVKPADYLSLPQTEESR